MTGMPLHVSCSIIIERSAYPDTLGSSTSAKTMSISWGFSFRVFHASKPSEAEWTVNGRRRKFNV